MKKKWLYVCLSSMLITVLHASEVKNPDKALKGRFDFTLNKVWEVDAAGEASFSRPRKIIVSENGTIYIEDPRHKKYFILDSNGKYKGAFGKQGEGPGEIQRIAQANIFLVNSKIIIADVSRLHYFTMEGKFSKSVLNQKRPVIFLDEDEFISSPIALNQMPDGKGKILKIDLKSKTESVLAEFSASLAGTIHDSIGARTYIAVGLTPMMVVGFHDGNVYYGMNHEYRIKVLGTDGKIKHIFSIPGRKKKPITDKVKRQQLESSPQKPPPDIIEKIVKSQPNECTYFDYIEVHNGLIYLFLSNPFPKNFYEIDIFSLEGKYLYFAQIKVEENLTIIRKPVIKNNHLYMAVEYEDGEVKIAKYKISLPKL